MGISSTRRDIAAFLIDTLGACCAIGSDTLVKTLVDAKRGKGAVVTDFGEALLEIHADSSASLAPVLDSVALDAAARLAAMVGSTASADRDHLQP